MPAKVQPARIRELDKFFTRLTAFPSIVERQQKFPSALERKRLIQQIHAPQSLRRPDDILRLQRSLGNHAVNQLMANRSIQAKLMVGAAHDRYEEEADRLAGLAASATMGETVEEPVTQNTLITPKVGFHTSDQFETRLKAMRGAGAPLPDAVRGTVEPLLGADLSGVRIHNDAESARLNRALNAQAFTHGTDIYLGDDKPDPRSSEGRRLLTHELVHVVQQGAANLGSLQTKIIQRFRDLRKLYDYEKWDEQGRIWLDEFSEIQALLADSSRVTPILEALNTYIQVSHKDLPTALADYEAGKWSKARPLFTEATTEPMFRDVIGKGQMFEDWVSQAHGVHTHRIQWYIVGNAIESGALKTSHTVTELYKESINKKWRLTKMMPFPNMWDRLVDESSAEANGPNDFTNPENLEAYLNKTRFAEWIRIGKEQFHALRAEARRIHKELPETKKALNESRPTREGKETLAREKEEQGTWTGWTGLGKPSTLYRPGDDPDEAAL